jgi:hypothetical protein
VPLELDAERRLLRRAAEALTINRNHGHCAQFRLLARCNHRMELAAKVEEMAVAVD